MKIRTYLFLFLCGVYRVLAQEPTAAINSKIDSIIQSYDIPALAVAIVKPNECIYGIGGTTIANGSDTVELFRKFHLGSNTKAVTSFIAMKLVENNVIQIATRLSDLVPELSGMSDSYKSITLGNLLSHTAGVQPYTSGQEYDKLPTIEGTLSEKRLSFAQFVLQEKAVKKGTYSNAGYVLAALMLERASGKSYEQLVDELASSLGIEYYWGFPNKEDTANPWGHVMEDNSLVPLPPDHFYHLEDYMCSAGDLSMNIIDYAKFLQLHLRGLLGEDTILKSTSYTAMHFGLNGYSYGWANSGTGTANALSFHDGSAGTYYCHTLFIPSKKIGITIMMNAAEETHIDGLYQLRDILLEEYTKLPSAIENDNHSVGFSVYPNPAQNEIRVVNPALENPNSTVQLINHLGEIVYSSHSNISPLHIPTDTLPNGIYIVVVTVPTEICTQKLIIHH